MGGDGGVKATSRRFMRGAKENNPATDEGKNAKELQIRRSKTCAQSGAALREPIVCCEMGILYNKDAMLTALLEKSINPSFVHVGGLKDLKTLKFCPNPEFRSEDGGEINSPYICPITKVEFNGQHPFVVIWPTGYVLSEKAIREVGLDNLQEEYGPFMAIDVVRLLPCDGEELQTQRTAMAERRLQRKHAKKSKKSNNISVSGGGNADDDNVAPQPPERRPSESGDTKRRKVKVDDGLSSSSSSSYAAAASKVTSLSSTKATVLSAQSAIASQLQKSAAAAAFSSTGSSSSNVYSKLFHKDGEKISNKRDLMMSTSGLRYTLG